MTVTETVVLHQAGPGILQPSY